MKRLALLVLASLALTDCVCGGTKKCAVKEDCAYGQICSQGECRAGSGAGGGSGGSTGSGGGSGTGGTTGSGGSGGSGGGTGGGIATGCSPTNPDNAVRDSDCDGLSDADEYTLTYGGGAKTDPCLADTDGDGIGDGVEVGRTSSPSGSCAGFVGDADPQSHTNPTTKDTDGDGLEDGVEDVNHDGLRQPTETDPSRRDSDCDGWSDKEELDGVPGCKTDPTKLDTDGDGLSDGVEGGLVPPGADPSFCQYTQANFDADTATKTNPCGADTDGDGIADGAEDTNHNGKFDSGELNPLDPADGAGPAQQACSTANLKPIVLHSAGASDVQVALVPAFAELTALADANGERGYIFYDAASKVAGLAISKGAAGNDASAEEAFGRSKIGTTGTVSSPLVQTYTTWDGFAGARGLYDLDGTTDLKTRVNDIAKAYLGGAVTGTLAGAAGVTGPFKVQATFVRRSATRGVAVIALVPAAAYTGQMIFRTDDVAGGTALAQFGDGTSTLCEVFAASVNQKVDFVWVVDDSGSMASSQTAVANAGSLFAARLNTAGLDWRAGSVTTGYYPNAYAGSIHDFTNNVATMTGWFSSSGFGTNGNATECGMAGARAFFDRAGVAGSGISAVRPDAMVHLIYLTDTAEQSNDTAQTFLAYLNTKLPGRGATNHGIICPEGQSCGDPTPEPAVGKYHTAIRQTNGVLGNIMIFNPTSPTAQQQAQQQATIDAIISAVVGGTGKQLTRPPISATIKVSMETAGSRGACTVNDIPRDRSNGWDIDSATRKIVFYGNCIPKAAGIKVAVSYKYWIDNSSDPNGDPCGGLCKTPFECNPSTKTCVCAPNCAGTCAAGLVCNMTSCACDPGIN